MLALLTVCDRARALRKCVHNRAHMLARVLHTCKQRRGRALSAQMRVVRTARTRLRLQMHTSLMNDQFDFEIFKMT
eukprot:6209379-Pleurochrysis_carterae.AAC.1